jgi:hypothetical protein
VPFAHSGHIFFFYFGLFNQYLRNKSSKKVFFKSSPFESRQSVRHDLSMNHVSAHDVTHFHVDIDCHINLTGSTTSFGTQNELRHFELRDSSMSRATHLDVTHFGSKSASLFFLSFIIFL